MEDYIIADSSTVRRPRLPPNVRRKPIARMPLNAVVHVFPRYFRLILVLFGFFKIAASLPLVLIVTTALLTHVNTASGSPNGPREPAMRPVPGAPIVRRKIWRNKKKKGKLSLFRFRRALQKKLKALRHPRRKKALLIGIQYELNEEITTLVSPHEDVQAVKNLLIDKYGYKRDDIVVMLDSADIPLESNLRPRQINILRQIELLVAGSAAEDRYVYYYSGHGLQQTSEGTEELDGLDESIVPEDYDGNANSSKIILDNELNDKLVGSLCPDSHLVAIIDSCHSGTMLDLRYSTNHRYYPKPKLASSQKKDSRRMCIYEHNPQSGTQQSVDRKASVDTDQKYQPDGNIAAAAAQCPAWFVDALLTEEPEAAAIYPTAIALSAGRDSQETYDHKGYLSFTKILINFLLEHKYPTLRELIDGVSQRTYLVTEQRWTMNEQYKIATTKWIQEQRPRLKTIYVEELTETMARHKVGDRQDPQMSASRKLKSSDTFILG